MSAISFISIGYLFIDLRVKLHYPKIRLTCCVLGRHEKSTENRRIYQQPLFWRKTMDSTYLINSFEEEGFSQKTSAKFCLLNSLQTGSPRARFSLVEIFFRPRLKTAAGYVLKNYKHARPSQRENTIQKSRQPKKN